MSEDAHHAERTSSHPAAIGKSAGDARCGALTEPRTNEGDERCHVEWLAQVAGGAGAGVEPSGGDLVVGGDEDDRRHFAARHEPILEIEAGERPQPDIQDETGGHASRDALEKLLARGEGLDAHPLHAQNALERTTDRVVVVDDPNPTFGLARRGRRRSLIERQHNRPPDERGYTLWSLSDRLAPTIGLWAYWP